MMVGPRCDKWADRNPGSPFEDPNPQEEQSEEDPERVSTPEEDEWIEVQSAQSLAAYNQDSVIFNSYIVSGEGFALSVGFSPIFGGNYSICFSGELRLDGCLTEDPDGDWMVSEWSIIYRIHKV